MNTIKQNRPEPGLRIVNFGTVFEPQEGFREDDRQDICKLFQNEFAVDVGGTYFGVDGTRLPIFDHHFVRKDVPVYPCAAVTVLSLASTIVELAAKIPETVQIRIVTHRQPDFDALCSVFLLCSLLKGEIIPEELSERINADSQRKIDWYSPYLSSKSKTPKWPILLASYAAHVDQCKRMHCSKSRAAHSVLYAGQQRGREWAGIGAMEFFEKLKEQIINGKLNPLYDDCFVNLPEFQPELDLLDREIDLYDHDIRRARKCIVCVKKNAGFRDWYETKRTNPFVEEALPTKEGACRYQIAAAQKFTDSDRLEVDAIFLRDPQCLLFKEWVRHDFDNSTKGDGFSFLAIAYSNKHETSSRLNKSEYYLSLDPEKSGDCHLYDLWAALQFAEIEHDDNKVDPACLKTPYRSDFKDRKLADPWFDGNTYVGTIVREPDQGTMIGPAGTRPDLMDDPVVEIVRSQLEYGWYATESNSQLVSIVDFPLKESCLAQVETFDIKVAVNKGLASDALRFASIKLNLNPKQLQAPWLRFQIGTQLWQLISDQGYSTPPSDFEHNRLIYERQSIIVWNRAGVAMAYCDNQLSFKNEIFENVKMLAVVSAGLTDLLHQRENKVSNDSYRLLCSGEELSEKIIKLRQQSCLPGGLVLHNIFIETRFDETLNSLQSLNENSNTKEEKKRDITLQIILLISTAFGLFFAWNGVEQLSLKELGIEWSQVSRYTLGAGLSVLLFGGYLMWLFKTGRRKRVHKSKDASLSTFKCRECENLGHLHVKPHNAE